MQVACDQLKHQSRHPDDQPSELILFAKLRIHVADVPLETRGRASTLKSAAATYEIYEIYEIYGIYEIYESS